MTTSATSWSRERSCGRSSPSWRCTRAGSCPTEQIVDALWGENPPAAVRNGLQGLASKLRRALGSAELVAMRGGGYALELPPEAVDVHRYEQLVAAGQAAAADGDPSRAVGLLAEADSLWRGDALADFTYEEFATAAITRLSELRLAVIEERIDLELALGRHQGVIVQLEALVAAHPLRERLRGLLMLALYRAGRQADALRVFQDGRHILGEELGLEPESRAPAVGVGHPRPGPIAGRSGGRRSRTRSPAPERARPSPKR